MLLQEKTTELKSTLIYFLIAAILGVLLRFAFVVEMPEWFKYKNIQHAHSHVAMMGWLSAAFYIFICKYFHLNRPIYKYIFWASQAAVLGMLISFPIQGYALFSILFSSAYMILSYVFIYAVFKDIGKKITCKLYFRSIFKNCIGVYGFVYDWCLGNGADYGIWDERLGMVLFFGAIFSALSI